MWSEFSSELSKIFYGIKDSDGWSLRNKVQEQLGLDWESACDYICKKKYEVKDLDIYYLQNSRIVSCWIGGTKGWCDWNGNIECSNYNIGKWPSIKEVYEEWCVIAKEFPYLNLRSQLMNCEAYEAISDDGENEPKPIVEFIVKDGKVEMVEPTEQLIPMTDIDISNRSEIGCTLEQFRQAVDYTKAKVAKEKMKAII